MNNDEDDEKVSRGKFLFAAVSTLTGPSLPPRSYHSLAKWALIINHIIHLQSITPPSSHKQCNPSLISLSSKVSSPHPSSMSLILQQSTFHQSCQTLAKYQALLNMSLFATRQIDHVTPPRTQSYIPHGQPGGVVRSTAMQCSSR